MSTPRRYLRSGSVGPVSRYDRGGDYAAYRSSAATTSTPISTRPGSSYASGKYTPGKSGFGLTPSASYSSIPSAYMSSRASSYDPYSTASKTTGSYRSPYIRSTGGGMSSSYHTDLSAKSSRTPLFSPSNSRYGTSSASTYKPPLPSIGMSSSYSSAARSGAGRSVGFSTPTRSTSYASLTDRRYGGTGSATNSSSSYARPDYRSQTPMSYRPTSRQPFERDYRSMSRFDFKESSVDRSVGKEKSSRRQDSIDETYSRLCDKYASKPPIDQSRTPAAEKPTAAESKETTQENASSLTSSTSSTASTDSSDLPAIRKFISHSEVEESSTSSASSEDEAVSLAITIDFALPKSKPQPPTPSKAKSPPPIAMDSAKTSAPISHRSTTTTPPGKLIVKPLLVGSAGAVAEYKPSKVPTAVDMTSTVEKSEKKSFEKDFGHLPTRKITIEKREPAGTSEMDKLLRMAEFEKDPKRALRKSATPPVVSEAVKNIPEVSRAKSEVSKSAPSSTPIKKTEVAVVPSSKSRRSATPKPTAQKKDEVTPSPKKPDSTTSSSASSTTSSKSTKSLPSKPPLAPSSSASKLGNPTSDLMTKSSPDALSEASSSSKKRNLRRERTIEMESFVDKSAKPVQPHPRPPLLLVTQPSLPNTPTTIANIVWAPVDEDDETEDEETYDEEDEEVEDESFDSDSEYEFTLSLPAPAATANTVPGATLSSGSTSRQRSTTPDFYDSEFELPLPGAVVATTTDTRNRVAQSDALPPPVFTASVSYDGQDEWGSGRDSLDSDSLDDSHYVSAPSRLSMRSPTGRGYMSPESYVSDEDIEFHDSIDVGCTLTLVQKAAMKTSDDEEDSEFYSDEYTDEEYTYYEDEEVEYTDEEIEEEIEVDEEEELIGDAETTASIVLPMDDKATKTETDKAKMDASPRSTTPEAVTMTKEKQPVAVKQTEKAENTEKTNLSSSSSQSILTVRDKSSTSVNDRTSPTSKSSSSTTPKAASTAVGAQKDITPVEKVKEQAKDERTGLIPKLETKNQVEPEKPTKKAPEQITSPQKSKESILKTTKEPEQKTTIPEAQKKSTAIQPVPQPTEDKSGVRKSTLNMSEKAKKEAEAVQAAKAKTAARSTGAVSNLRDRFREPTPPKEEKYTYKRSSRLDAPDTARPRRTYAPIVKPVIDDAFDQQVKEIREKIKTGTTKMAAEYKDLTKGIAAKVDERKLQTLASIHQGVIDSTQSLLSTAESEKKRWQTQHESEVEKRHREKLEREAQAAEKRAKELADAKAAESAQRKVITRRVAGRTPEPSPAPQPPPPVTPTATAIAASKSPSTSGNKATPPPAKPSPSTLEKSSPSPAPAVTKKLAAKTQPITPVTPTTSAVDDLESFATAIAAPRPKLSRPLPQSVQKSEAGGVATKIRKALAPPPTAPSAIGVGVTTTPTSTGLQSSSPATTKMPPLPDAEAAAAGADIVGIASTKAIPYKVRRRSSTRRKTDEIIFTPPGTSTATTKRRRQQHRKNPFTKTPTDIDDFLGWDKENVDSFEAMEAFFEKENVENSPKSRPTSPIKKRRRVEPLKVWISELQDIDRIYKSSELRDIKLSAYT